MPVIRYTRFTIDPATTEQLLARRAALIEAIHASCPGLTGTRLVRFDDDTWSDEWRWESAEALQAASASAPGIPEVAAAFTLTRDLTAVNAVVVDER
jgi:quinol monooxygenase YgiN